MCIIGTWASSSTGCVYLGKQMCSGSIAAHVMALLFFLLLLGYCCNSEMRGLHLKWSDKGRGFWVGKCESREVDVSKRQQSTLLWCQKNLCQVPCVPDSGLLPRCSCRAWPALVSRHSKKKKRWSLFSLWMYKQSHGFPPQSILSVNFCGHISVHHESRLGSSFSRGNRGFEGFLDK